MENNKKEKHIFQSETKELLKLMIHSLYSNKEIFIRELISNASDAIDKMKFKFLSPKNSNIPHRNMLIKIYIDKKEKKITISDNGIGMTKKEIIKNLGTIAHSGTKKFIQSLGDKKINDTALIGKFGVGFYSSFIVSNKVIVKTRHYKEVNENNGIMWESEGKGEYFINNIKKPEYGTDIEIYLKKEEQMFLENWKISEIIKKYSDHIDIPIEIQEYDSTKNIFHWKKINKAKSLWTMKKSEIKKEEYKKFYTYITQDNNPPLTWIHSQIEGTQQYTILLYIPSKSNWNIWDRENEKKGLKLYVKKTYIMDNANQFLPNYLRFVKGIIDTNNLPLNISREMLQENHVTKVLKKSLTKKILTLIQKLSINDVKKYKIFWKEFGLILKEGLSEDISNKNKIADLLRFTSIKCSSKEETLSLEQYINDMHKKQNKIYYITSDNYESGNTSPHLEIFRKKNINVLILHNKIDEWMMNHLTEFQNKQFQSINKSDNELETIFHKPSNADTIENNMKVFLQTVQNTLQDKVQSVKLSYRLIDTPVVLLLDKNSMSTQMSKLFIAAGQNIPETKYILEINPNHDLIKKIVTIQDEETIKKWINILFDQALLSERGSLDNPNEFIKNINKFLLTK